MKTFAKAVLGALALASLCALAPTPASAQSFGFSFNSGPAYGGYGGYYRPNPCFRPYPYRPYYCDYGYRGRPYYAYGYGRPYRGYYGRPYRYRDPYWRRW